MKKGFQNNLWNGIWGLLLIAVLGFQVHLLFVLPSRQEQPAFEPGDKLPDFRLKSLEGKEYQLDQLVKEKPVLLIFFSPENTSCRLAVIEINEYLNSQKEAEFQALLISDASRRALLEFAQEGKITLPILLDPDSRVVSAYQVSSVPSTFLIDEERRLLYSSVGTEGFNVYKIQARLKVRGLKFEFKERSETAPSAPGQEQE